MEFFHNYAHRWLSQTRGSFAPAAKVMVFRQTDEHPAQIALPHASQGPLQGAHLMLPQRHGVVLIIGQGIDLLGDTQRQRTGELIAVKLEGKAAVGLPLLLIIAEPAEPHQPIALVLNEFSLTRIVIPYIR